MIETWGKANPLTARAEIDPDTGEQVWSIDGKPPDAPDDLTLLLGECLYNFRSALDHLAWQLDKNPGRHTMFPLARCFSEWRVNRLRGMPDEAIAMIANLQPCYGSNAYAMAMLWGLETFMNIDKHRHLNVVAAGFGDGIWGAIPSFIHVGAIEDGTVILRFPPGQMQMQLLYPPAVAFSDSGEMPTVASVNAALVGIDTVLCYIVQDFRNKFFPGEPDYPFPNP